jgi:hypothetical protein
MKRLALALAAATMVALTVPAAAQTYGNRSYLPWGGPLYYYDSVTGKYYGGIEVTPRARTYVYDRQPYRYSYSSGPSVGYRSWDDRYVIGDGYRRGWWRGW